MKKKTLAVFVLFAASHSYGQEVISTQGDSYSNGSANIDYTIGEVVINTVSNGSNDLTQGFHQTNWNFAGVEEHDVHFDASIFPNPAEDNLNISTSKFEGVTYTLYDDRGRVVLSDLLQGEITAIEVSYLAPGAYSLMLRKEERPLRTFKLIKHK